MTDKEITDRLISLISEYTADLKRSQGHTGDFQISELIKNPALC